MAEPFVEVAVLGDHNGLILLVNDGTAIACSCGSILLNMSYCT